MATPFFQIESGQLLFLNESLRQLLIFTDKGRGVEDQFAEVVVPPTVEDISAIVMMDSSN